jgi:hypothetical protein
MMRIGCEHTYASVFFIKVRSPLMGTAVAARPRDLPLLVTGPIH